jgi:hypothetical protein
MLLLLLGQDVASEPVDTGSLQRIDITTLSLNVHSEKGVQCL